jgi:hypothetical protein
MRLKHLPVYALASVGVLALGAPARAEPGSVVVPLDHGFGWNAYPPSFWMSPSYRTCRQVSKPSPGWVCAFAKPPFIEKPYDDAGQAVRAKPAKKRQAQKAKQAKQGAYAAKPKAGKQSAKLVKRRAAPG